MGNVMSEENKRELEDIPLAQEMLTVIEAAKEVKVSERTIRRWMQGGGLIYYQADDNGPIRILRRDLWNFFEKHRNGPEH